MLLDLDNRPVDPFQNSSAKAQVFLFLRSDCPISNRYAPELRRLVERFSSQGIDFFLVYPDPDSPAAAVREHLKEYGYTSSALRDPRHRLVALTGARVTPEAAVFVNRRMVYRGRIDDRYVAFGKMRPAPTARDLEETLAAVLNGEKLTPRTTEAVGCYIADLKR